MTFLGYLLCADSSKLEGTSIDMQRSLMLRVLGLETLSSMNMPGITSIYTYEKTVDTVCTWEGVNCDEHGIIRKISWVNYRTDTKGSAKYSMVYMNLQWLPPTLTEVIIRYHKWMSQPIFDAKAFPREAQTIDITACQLSGELDLTRLPRQLLVLRLPHNRLSGTVMLHRLPSTMERLDLEYNSIAFVGVDNDTLPKNLEAAKFLSARKIRYGDIHGRRVDDRIEVYQQRGEKAKKIRI